MADKKRIIETRHNLLHAYSVTLFGIFINPDKTLTPNHYLTKNITSEINCNIGDDRILHNTISSHQALIQQLQDDFGSCFQNEQFEIVAIYQHK